jgi:hypothetical protein
MQMGSFDRFDNNRGKQGHQQDRYLQRAPAEVTSTAHLSIGHEDFSPTRISSARIPPLCSYFRRQVVQVTKEADNRPDFVI